MISSTTAPVTASTWRRKRRQVSSAGEIERALRSWAAATTVAGASAERDAGVEPAIEDICNEVEEDDETGEHEGDAHHDGRVVGEDRGDQQRADAGYAENLLGDDGATEHRRQLQCHQRDDRDHGVAHHVP